MRNQREESPCGRNDEVRELGENRKSVKNRSLNIREDEFRASRQESGTDYHRDSSVNAEDQVETSKLVLQLVTDSRFNMTQVNGQRKLGGPPPGWKGPAPGPGCEVFVGKIPRTLYEHEIYPIFRSMGEVYEIRLMMDFSGTNRGYCFVMYGKPEFAQRAIDELDNSEIRPGRRIGVVASINNCRLYVGQLPQDVNSETVIRKIYDITDDVGQVSVYRNANDQARYALISYRTHRGAAMARRRLVPDRGSLFAGGEVSIDWAHPSMLPSNVVEDTGVCDDHGNLEISRLVVGNENKRYQNRRRVRDDFLDHSIRAYLQTERGLDHQSMRNKQNLSQNQSFGNSLGSLTRGINSFHICDQNGNTRGQNHPLNQISRPDKSRCKIEIARKLKDSNSSFDLNGGSGESESSGCSSQSSAASERHHNLSKEFSDPPLGDFYSSQIFYHVDNEAEIGIKTFAGGSNDPGAKKLGKNDAESLNLFDNYTFSANCRDAENRGSFEDFEYAENSDNEAGKISNGDEKFASFYERGENFLPNIRKDSEAKQEAEIGRENERKSRDFQRCKNFLNIENNNLGENPNGGFNALQKSMKCYSRPRNSGDSIPFPKTVGVPLKNEFFKLQTASNSSNFSRQQNRTTINPSLWNKNSKNSPALHLVAENYQQQNRLCENGGNRSVAHASNKIANLSNARGFSHSTNSNGKRAWISAQFASSSNNFGNTSVNNPPIYSGPEFSGEQQLQFLQSANRISGFAPRVHSPIVNFNPGHNFPNSIQTGCYQGKKFPGGKNTPRNGRPILSRSYASFCNEN